MLKNAVLNNPFAINKNAYPLVEKLFSEILFNQTIEKLI
jgi:hypothetical protein